MLVYPKGALASALLLTTCARSGGMPPDGSLGGACYGNNTCDARLVCNGAGLCVDPDPCAGVECSGHGTCVVDGAMPSCRCEAGFASEGLACLPCTTPECDRTCPPEMVEVAVGPSTVCIDRYEASAWQNPDCTGTQYGASVDDYPGGFPVQVASSGCEGACIGLTTTPQTEPVYACSAAGVRPSTNLSWFRAKRACENSGKELCAGGVWRAGCRGPDGLTWPYGHTFDPFRCNTSSYGAHFVLTTGEMGDCEGGYPGLFDMSGNVAEWVLDCNATDCGSYGGGAWSGDTRTDCIIASDDASWAPNATSGRGFRCCLTL